MQGIVGTLGVYVVPRTRGGDTNLLVVKTSEVTVSYEHSDADVTVAARKLRAKPF